jgi:integrase/recombinase XerD
MRGERVRGPWPEMLVLHLQTYLADYRSDIAALCVSRTGIASEALWLSMYGPPMTDNGIYDRIVARTREGLGQAINPHLFRDCAATSIAIDDPAHVGIASPLAWSSHRIDHRTLLQPSAQRRSEPPHAGPSFSASA